jgi:hypothetical protein
MGIPGTSQTVLRLVRKMRGLTANAQNTFEWGSQLSKVKSDASPILI